VSLLCVLSFEDWLENGYLLLYLACIDSSVMKSILHHHSCGSLNCFHLYGKIQCRRYPVLPSDTVGAFF